MHIHNVSTMWFGIDIWIHKNQKNNCMFLEYNHTDRVLNNHDQLRYRIHPGDQDLMDILVDHKLDLENLDHTNIPHVS